MRVQRRLVSRGSSSVSAGGGSCRFNRRSKRGCTRGDRPPGRNLQVRFSGSRRFGAQTIQRSCSRIVLIAEVDERRLAFCLTANGLASPKRGGERASEAGSRRQSRENGGGFPARPAQAGGGSTRRWKASWSVDVGVFDETAAKAGLVFGSRRAKERELRRDMAHRARQRTSEATPSTRAAVENAATEGHRRRGCRSQHPPGPSGVSFHVSSAPAPEGPRKRWLVRAEAGESPSSEAPPGSLVAPAAGAFIGSGLGPGQVDGAGRRPQGRRRAHTGVDQSEGCSLRESVADIGETHLLRSEAGRREASRGGRGSLKRPPCH
jgi:hypothetical protein